MTDYVVTWVIDVDADSPEEAARKALDIQRDPESTANCFDVAEYGEDCRENHGKYIDLGECPNDP